MAANLMGTHNICFYGEFMKIILQLSSNTHLIYSTACMYIKNIWNIHEKQHWISNPTILICNTNTGLFKITSVEMPVMKAQLGINNCQ